MEAAIRKAAERYRQASHNTVSPRETEIAAFGAVTRGLRDAQGDRERIIALGKNHQLWSILVRDLALAGNGLPETLKAELVSLGLWAMRYSTLAVLKNLPLEPLITVNQNVLAGLQAQATPPSLQPATVNGSVHASA
jgi:flagellar protein FlaF